jgi:FHA domain
VATLERHGPAGFDLLFIDETRSPLSVGKSPENDLVIDNDEAVSRLHAQLERVGPAWCITDLGARNGTFVNGQKIVTTRKLFDRDEILMGRTRLVLNDSSARGGGTTQPVRPPPARTPTEQRVLVELCRPVLSGQAFTSPAAVGEIARALYVGRAAVQQHLGHLYDKFGLHEPGNRRVLLANAAIQCQAVTIKDLQQPPGG